MPRRRPPRSSIAQRRAASRRPRRPSPARALARDRRFSPSAQQERARVRLRAFRRGSSLAVALTAILLLIWGVPDETTGQDVQPVEPDTPAVAVDPAVSIEQAAGTLRELLIAFYGFLPKIALAMLLIAFAALAGRVTARILRRALSRWEKAEAVSALARIALYLGAIAVSLSIIAGDANALLGSVGLVGLALSWALQTPIESFTGWLLNSFRTYEALLARARIAFSVDEDPSVFFSPADAWINCTIRYLVDARRRRRVASAMIVALSQVTADPAHAGRIVPAYPRTDVRIRDGWPPPADPPTDDSPDESKSASR